MRSNETTTHFKASSYAYRIDKQLTMEKPKRPLSSFNLFYRYKRFLVTGQGNISEEAVKRILFCPAGLEDELLTPSKSHQSQRRPSSKTNEIRRNKIRTALEGKILPSTDKKKRRHRKAENGPSISFVEMGRLMTESWKHVDPFARQVFDDLAGEGRQFYKDALEEYTRMEGPANDTGEVLRAAQSKSISTEKVSVHKVSRSVKKDTMLSTRSQESRRVSQARSSSSNVGLESVKLPRTNNTASQAGSNPEYTSRAFQNSGFSPAPAPAPESSGTRSTGNYHQFPTQSFQVEDQLLLPQPNHQPQQLYHQQQYHQYLQRQQLQQEGNNHDANLHQMHHDANLHQMHHDAYSTSIDVLSHLASPRRIISRSAATGGGGGRDNGQHAGVDHNDFFAENPADLNLQNEDIKTFFDAVDRRN